MSINPLKMIIVYGSLSGVDHEEVNKMDNVFQRVEVERELPHNSASHSNALVENPFEGDE